jgi:hypothetical protein
VPHRTFSLRHRAGISRHQATNETKSLRRFEESEMLTWCRMIQSPITFIGITKALRDASFRHRNGPAERVNGVHTKLSGLILQNAAVTIRTTCR